MLGRRTPVDIARLSTRRFAAHVLAHTHIACKHGELRGVRCYRSTSLQGNSQTGKPNLIRFHGAPIQPRAQALLDKQDHTAEGDEEADEWDTITALEASRKKQDWRQGLESDEAWEFESDLDGLQEDQQLRLIHLHSSDLELWEALFLYRLKNFGPDGGKMIWKHLDKAVSAHPMRIWERPRLWKPLLELALADIPMLNNLVYHCNGVATRFNDYPDAFYLDVMKYALFNHAAADVLSLHASMKVFPPLKSELETLFNAIASHQELLKIFQSFCFELPAFSGMYKHVIPRLARADMLAQVLEWHDLLLKRRDVPASFDVVKDVLRRLRKDGHSHSAQRLAWQLHTAGVPGGRSWLQLRDPVFTETRPGNNDDTSHKANTESLPMNELQLGGFPARQLSDAFIARLLATSFFSTETILAGLSAISVTEVGSLAFRQLLFRLASDVADPGSAGAPMFDANHVERARALLTETKIDLKQSTFSNVVLQLAEENNVSLLQSVLESDQHPDVLDDLELQEALLARYVERDSRDDINRTLAILRISKGETYSMARKGDVANMQLLLAVDRKDKSLASIILREITQAHQNLEYHSLTGFIYGLVFSPRAMGSRPDTYRELDEATDLMMNLQRSGYAVPQRAWQELIRRRFWEANLLKIQKLLEWKFNWITDARYRRAQTYSDARPFDWERYYHNWSANMENRNSYLTALFNKHVQAQLVVVGFAKDLTLRGPQGTERSPLLPGTADEKSKFLANDTCLWGLRLLKMLHSKGLPMSPDEVKKVCSGPLTTLFGPAIPATRMFRRMQMLRRANWIDYATAMERVWGTRIFLPAVGAQSLPASIDETTRLQDYCKRTLLRTALRMRLRIEQQLNHYTIGGRRIWWAGRWHSWTAHQQSFERDMRAWHQSLPIVDTDSYIRTLIPELTSEGKLENDPLLSLSKLERWHLMGGVRARLETMPLEGFSLMDRHDVGRLPAQTWSSLHGRKRVWWQKGLLKAKSHDWHAEAKDQVLEEREQRMIQDDEDHALPDNDELDTGNFEPGKIS